MATYKFKGKTLLMAIQAVIGVPEALLAADGVKSMELTWKDYQGDKQELAYDDSGQANNPEVNVNPRCEFDFKTSAFASGTAGTLAPLDVCFRACGMNVTVDPGVSVTYGTIDVTKNTTEFVTAWVIRGNLRHQTSDAMGDLGFEIKSGQFAKFMFGGFIGQYITPEEQLTTITPTYSDWKDPLPSTKVNTPVTTIGGWQGCVDQVTFTMGNQIVKHDRSGCAGVTITGRTPTGKMVVEAPDIASKNFWSEAESHTGTINLYDVVVQHGVNPGTIFGATIEDCQITNISEVDLDGTLGYEFDLNPTSNNPLTMVFT